MACYSWTLVAERLGFEAEEFPAMSLWQARMAERPGVQRGMALLDEKRQDPSQMDEETRRNMFGDRQHARNGGQCRPEGRSIGNSGVSTLRTRWTPSY